jgi:glutathione S-transferase
MRAWTKRIDEKVHPCAGVLTYAIGTRPMLLQRSAEEIDAHIAQLPSPAKRAERRSVIDHGVKAPEFAGAVRGFVALVDDMEAALANKSWLAGEDISQADAAALPYVLRIDHLGMASLLQPDIRPRVADWFARVQARPSYEVAVRALLPQFVIDMFRTNGAAVWADVEALTHSQ